MIFATEILRVKMIASPEAKYLLPNSMCLRNLGSNLQH